MKATDYRVPWGRPSEHLLAVQQEINDQQMHVKRVKEARSLVDSVAPYCAEMPHMVAQFKKKQMREDRQREIAQENHSLMHRLTRIMREERHDPLPQFKHLSTEYRESLRRKKLLKLEGENRRLARAIKGQQPFYSTGTMVKAEGDRQALLKTMSRTQRRRERISLLAKVSNNSQLVGRTSSSPSISCMAEEGVVFRPGSTVVKLRTAKQMQHEVARARGARRGRGGPYMDSKEWSDLSGVQGGAGSRTSKLGTIAVGKSEKGSVVLEMHHTGIQASTGHPNLIFTPSLIPASMKPLAREHSMIEDSKSEGLCDIGDVCQRDSCGSGEMGGEVGGSMAQVMQKRVMATV